MQDDRRTRLLKAGALAATLFAVSPMTGCALLPHPPAPLGPGPVVAPPPQAPPSLDMGQPAAR